MKRKVVHSLRVGKVIIVSMLGHIWIKNSLVGQERVVRRSSPESEVRTTYQKAERKKRT